MKAREKEKQELKEDENGIINFGTEENKDRRKEKSDDDPLSQNAGGWDDDGFVFEDEEDGFIFS